MPFGDKNLMFYGTAPFNSISNYTSMIGWNSTSTTTNSTAINLGVAEDMGIGDGEAVPKLGIYFGTAVTAACGSLRLNFQFQGSTDSSNWTVYAETGALPTTSMTVGAKIMPWDIPHRPAGVSLPQYYRVGVVLSGQVTADAISGGSIFGGILIQRNDNISTLYPSNFTVV